MGKGNKRDLARQTVNVFGALFQVGVMFAASAAIPRLGALRDGTRTQADVAA